MNAPAVLSGGATAGPGDPDAVTRVYVWELPVRLTHWAIAGSLLVAAVSGLFIANPPLTWPGSARPVTMSQLKLVHEWAAVVFTAAVLGRLLWGFTGNAYARWSAFLPSSRRRLADLFGTFAFYTFLRRDPPPTVGHNGLASLAYLAVFGLYLLMIATGLALWSASAAVGSYLGWFGFLQALFGGLATARFLHHLTMWLLLGFFAHHFWSALLMSRTERNGTMESIFSGYKFVPRHDRETTR